MSVQAERYEGAEPYVFISYSHADSERVLAIVAAMEKRGYRVWYDAGINAGQQWTETLANKIAGCEVFLLFASVSYMASFAPDSMRPFCRLEVVHAQKTRRQMVPVRLDETAFPYELNFLIGNPQQIRPAADETAEAFAARLDVEPLFQRCRAGTAQTPAPLAEIVTQSRPAAPSGAFVGREDKIQAIEDAFRDGQTAVVLYGMGGIGKSEICRKLFWEYAHGAGTLLAGRIGWSMWRGTPKETFYGQFRDIREENAEIHWQQARIYLETLGSDLLMFLDNADTLTETDAAELTQLGCRFLITSRKRPGRLFAIPAGTLMPEQCRILYRRSLYEDGTCADDTPDTALDEILRLVEYHTLSVQLLAKTQWVTGLDMLEMLSQLQKPDFDLNSENIAYLHNPEQKHSVEEEAAFIDHMSRIFDLSQLQETKSGTDTLRVLQGMSLLAPNTPTPVRDVKKWMNLPNLNGLNRAVKAGWLSDALENDVRKVSIHPVVVTVVRHAVMPDKKLIDMLAGHLAHEMDGEISEGYIRNLSVVKHAQTLDRLIQSLSICTDNSASMLNQIGCSLIHKSEYEDALTYLQRAVCMQEKIFGAEALSIIQTYNNIGMTYGWMGDYPTALKWLEKSLYICEKSTQKDTLDVSDTYCDLGTIYHDMGKYSDSLQFHQKALAIRERTVGTNHAETGKSYAYIAGVYRDQGLYVASLDYYNRALEVQLNVLGTNHPSTALTYNEMGVVYQRMEKYSQAIKYYKKALRIYIRTIGNRHHDIAAVYNNIALAYRHLGDYKVAGDYFQKSVAVCVETLGKGHPHTGILYGNIAQLNSDMHNYDEALKYARKAVHIHSSTLGGENPITAKSYSILGETYQKMGANDKALICFQDALLIREKVLPKGHPDVISTCKNIANIYSSMGNLWMSAFYYKKADSFPEPKNQ